MTGIVQHVSRTVDVVEIPVIDDMDTGDGNALNLVRAARQYEKARVSAFTLKVQASPKKCSHYEGAQLLTSVPDLKRKLMRYIRKYTKQIKLLK